jgi:uncharacterized membrane protein
MTLEQSPSLSRPPWVVHVVRLRPRLFSSLLVASVVTAALVAMNVARARPLGHLALDVGESALIGWDIGVALYLLLAFHMMATSEVHHIRGRAAVQDEGRFTILVLIVAAALVSVGAIFAELSTALHGGAQRGAPQLVLATITILGSWALIHTIFALHYAHEFYDETGGRGMAFPGGDEEPDYWDFIYFSFVIGMTSQVSDVAITSKEIRRTAAAHGIVSFLFNAALLALTVNIAASAI